MATFVRRANVSDAPRIPLQATIDLTYRCNNRCRHCWLCLPPNADDANRELSLNEIVSIVDQGRNLGCREWHIHGGEPMIRPDFEEIFDYITSKCKTYTLNTNGTLITPKIANLLKKKGSKLVALYGATADVHDHVTRNPGSYEATIRGMRYLKEAGAGFTVQIVPMRDNEHQLEDMRSIADSLGAPRRIGAAWLWLTACGDPARNEEIARQRLDPCKVLELDKPYQSEDPLDESEAHEFASQDDHLFSGCIATRRDFHIDPYGGMSFCCFIKDLGLRYDLRKGTVREGWDEFIPSLAHKVCGGPEYAENCGSCESRSDCRWCPVYAYLEHGRFSAKVDYLCAVARETGNYRRHVQTNNRRYFGLGGLAIRFDSDLPITDSTFHPKMLSFQIDKPSEVDVTIHHRFNMPPKLDDLGEEVYRRAPYSIYKRGSHWIYATPEFPAPPSQVLVFDSDYSRVTVYNSSDDRYQIGGLTALTMMPTDQVMLAQVMAHKDAFFVHSSGAAIDGNGFLFVGHSEAGKSTMATLLNDRAEVLCDERIVVRKWPDGIWIHGSWSHGQVPIVSPNKAPLRAICFIHKDTENRLEPVHNKRLIASKLVACVAKPHETKEWWEKTLVLADEVASQVPAYDLYFDKSGKIYDVLSALGEQMERPDGVLC